MIRIGTVRFWLSVWVLGSLLLIGCTTSDPIPATQSGSPPSVTSDAVTTPPPIPATEAINVIDEIGIVPLGSILGSSNAIAVGSDGLAIVSYYDGNSAELKVAHCSNAECSSVTISTLEGVGGTGGNSSITIGSDGLGLISFGNYPLTSCSPESRIVSELNANMRHATPEYNTGSVCK